MAVLDGKADEGTEAGDAMGNSSECLKCRLLRRHYKEIPVKRRDGTNEVAGWFECEHWHEDIVTISKYDPPGCPWYEEGEGSKVYHGAEVRRGHWEKLPAKEWPWEYKCTACGEPEVKRTSYCPQCAAMMDEHPWAARVDADRRSVRERMNDDG